MSHLRLSDSLDKTIDIGPLVDESQMKSVEEFVQSARDEGAEVSNEGAEVSDDGAEVSDEGVEVSNEGPEVSDEGSEISDDNTKYDRNLPSNCSN